MVNMVYPKILQFLIITLFFHLNAANIDKGLNDLEGRILNGDLAPIEAFPYFASLWGICGGVILSARWVLTAAHCFLNFEPDFNKNKIYVGGESIGNSQGVHFDKVIIHSVVVGLMAVPENDIALIRLSRPLEFSHKIQPVDISSNPRPMGSSVVFAGRGIDETGEVSERLKKANLVILTTEQCLEELEPQSQSSASMFKRLLENTIICAKQRDRETRTCYGDSGAPLVDRSGLIGLLSFGHGGEKCEDEILPFFVNVTTYLPWIREQTGLTLSQSREHHTPHSKEYSGTGGYKHTFKAVDQQDKLLLTRLSFT